MIKMCITGPANIHIYYNYAYITERGTISNKQLLHYYIQECKLRLLKLAQVYYKLQYSAKRQFF